MVSPVTLLQQAEPEHRKPTGGNSRVPIEAAAGRCLSVVKVASVTVGCGACCTNGDDPSSLRTYMMGVHCAV